MGAIALIGWAMLIGLIGRRRYVGSPTSVSLLQYQGGILYKRGYPVRELDAGKHRVWAGIEKVILVDKRPSVVNFENRAVALADGATAVYGFSASAQIQELTKALYSARNYNETPAYVFLCCTRRALNDEKSENLLSRQGAIAQDITSKAKLQLAAKGFQLQEFRFTHLAIANPPPAAPSPARSLGPHVH